MPDEQATDVQGQGAPAAQPSSGAAQDHPAGLTSEDVRRMLHEEFGPAIVNAVAAQFNQHGAALYQGVQGLLDGKVSEIRKELGISREQAETLKAMAGKVLDASELEGVSERAKAAEVQRRLDELEREKQAAQQQAAALARQQALAAEANRRGALDQGIWQSQVTQMREYAESQGVDFDAAYQANAKEHTDAQGQHRLPQGTKDDPTGLARYVKAFRAKVDALADAAEADAQPKVRADSTRSAGGGAAAEWENYQKALREGGQLPSAAEIDRMVAARFR